MRSQPLSERYRNAVPVALVVLAILFLLDVSGGIATHRSLASTSPGAVPLKITANLASLTGAVSTHTRVRLGETQSPAEAFNALNRLAGGTLDVTWDAPTGTPRFLTGDSKSARIPYTPTAAERGNPLAIARGFLDENRALFRLDSVGEDFGAARIEPDKQLNFSNIRLPQVYKGIPVFGRQLVVHLDAGGQVVAVNGQYLPGLNIPAQPSITKELAEQTALDDIKQNELDAAERGRVTMNLLKDKTALAVYAGDNGKATLSWEVHVLTDSPLGQWLVFVNARRPVVVHATNTLEDAKFRRTYSAGNGTDIPGQLLAEEGERTSDQIGQAAHDAAGKVYDYYFKTFKRDAIDGQGSPMVSTVHYGTDPQDSENAAWISEAQQMVYGDGGQIFKPLAYGLDVVGHEFTHGITDSTAQLVYEGQSGALNESYSDVFGAMIDRANWTIGEAVVKSPPFPVPYLRSLQDPELQGNYDPTDPLAGIGQPGDMSKYANLPINRSSDYGGVHINSGIPSHAAYFVAQAIGKDKMEQIYYRTLTQYLSPDANFADAGRASMQAATDLYSATEANAVRTAFGQVGINLGATTSGPTPPPARPTAGPSTQPTPQSLPQGCRELITNGGFESDAGWKQASSSHTSIIDPELPHTGSQSAWLGGTDKETLQYIFQDVAVPANANSANLTYYYQLHEEFSGLGSLLASDATFKVIIANTQGNQIAALATLSSTKADDQWHQAQFDLARYAGQTIRLVFSSENPRGNISSFFVDDVSLAACTTGQPPSAPSASGDQVYVDGYIDDADTNRGIPGAQLFILKPGITATQAASDQQVTDNEVLTYGTADNDGYYQTQDPVTRGKTYSVIVIADGYRPVIADNGMDIPADAGNPTEIDATMRVGP